MKADEFGRRLAALEAFVINNVLVYDVVHDVIYPHPGAEHSRAFDNYGGALIPVTVALRRMTIINLAEVFDQRRDVISIPKLLRDM
ncbi:MAG: hypothetical protein ACE5Q6_20310, partial [Dehalococcoidia bacterium]